MIPCTKVIKGEQGVHSDRKAGPLFVWNITSRCNLRCGHCYRDSAPENRCEQLSDEKCLELVAQIKALNPPIALLSGGEPLLRPNVFDIIAECKALSLRVGLSTNGTLIDKKMAFRIRESGADYVGISIDGKRESHDIFRGSKGAFQASWQALKYLNGLGVKTGVRFTLTDSNKEDLMEILDKTVQSGTKRFCLYHLVYSGRGSQGLDMNVKDKRERMNAFFNRVRELSLSEPGFEVLTTDNPADGVFMSMLVNGEASMSCASSHGGCSAGDRVLYLDSTGRVYPCQFLREYPLGDVNEMPLRSIWENNENIFLKQLRNKKDLLKGKCGECTYKAMCGGCRARAKAYYGSLWDQDPACYLGESEIKQNAVHV